MPDTQPAVSLFPGRNVYKYNCLTTHLSNLRCAFRAALVRSPTTCLLLTIAERFFVRSIFKGAFRGLPRLKLLSVRFAYRNILHISRISIFTCTLSLYKVPIMLELIDTSVQGRQIFWSPGFYPALSCY